MELQRHLVLRCVCLTEFVARPLERTELLWLMSVAACNLQIIILVVHDTIIGRIITMQRTSLSAAILNKYLNNMESQKTGRHMFLFSFILSFQPRGGSNPAVGMLLWLS